jgi:hypothetical protein
MFFVQPDGSAIMEGGKIQHPQGIGHLRHIHPSEPEVLGIVHRYGLQLYSPKDDGKGNYTHLGSKPMTGPDSGESRGLGFVQGVDTPGFKGVIAAIEGGMCGYPIGAFLPGGKDEGWRYNTGGVPAVAALVEDFDGDGKPEALLGRLDGFVNVLGVADGKEKGLLNAGEPILGMALLKGKGGKPCLAVGTKFGVHLFSGDGKRLGRQTASLAAFAGPGGKGRDRVFGVSASGRVTVFVVGAPEGSASGLMPGKGAQGSEAGGAASSALPSPQRSGGNSWLTPEAFGIALAALAGIFALRLLLFGPARRKAKDREGWQEAQGRPRARRSGKARSAKAV